MAATSELLTSTPARRRSKIQSNPLSFGLAAQLGAPITSVLPMRPNSIRLPGSTGMPRRMMSPPAATKPAGTTSPRSTIADAEKTMIGSAPTRRIRSIASPTACGSWVTVSTGPREAPSALNRSSIAVRRLASTFALVAVILVRIRPAVRGANALTVARPDKRRKISSAAFIRCSGSANVMTLTVAII